MTCVDNNAEYLLPKHYMYGVYAYIDPPGTTLI